MYLKAELWKKTLRKAGQAKHEDEYADPGAGCSQNRYSPSVNTIPNRHCWKEKNDPERNKAARHN